MNRRARCPGPWCNCDECARWRGGRRIPDRIVQAMNEAATRPLRPFTFDPPLEASHINALARVHANIDLAMAMSWIFPKGSRAGLPLEWTREDLDLLRTLKIDPWK